MKISSAKRLGPGYKFYESGPDSEGNIRENSFVAMPRDMVDEKTTKNVKVNWSRAVAFGDVAELINNLYEKGVSIFKLDEGRIRTNDMERQDGTVFKSNEIVVEKLLMKDFDKALAKIGGKGVYKEADLPNAV